MWIVRLALKRPDTFIVMALLIVVLGLTSIRQMRTDSFPEINIPVVTVICFSTIIGMLPMSLGLGEGGEQNAPLGRAVIGGLFVATLTTLLFVPVVYSLLRRGEVTARE